MMHLNHYIISAYLIVSIFLMMQWYIPWRRWKHFLNEQPS
jgi:hypothetical protein